MKMSTSVVASGLVLAGALSSHRSPRRGPCGTATIRGWTSNSHTRLLINDGEADGDTAYSKGRAGNGSSVRVNDLDGSGNSAWYITVNTAVQRHATCENWNNRPDPCSGWVYNF